VGTGELVAGTAHVPLAEVTDEPVSTYPLQFVLFTEVELPLMLAILICGAVIRLGRANAGLSAAKSISKPTKNADSLVEVFIRFHPFFVYNSKRSRRGKYKTCAKFGALLLHCSLNPCSLGNTSIDGTTA
jgi:hypothetical protein